MKKRCVEDDHEDSQEEVDRRYLANDFCLLLFRTVHIFLFINLSILMATSYILRRRAE